MTPLTLDVFATKVAAKNRISFGDVRRLQRDILGHGIGSREEAELLIGLDRSVGRADPAWAEWLVPALVDFVVWGNGSAGCVEGETAGWLVAVLSSEPPAKTARRILREIIREAESVDETLLAFARTGAKPRLDLAPDFPPEPFADACGPAPEDEVSLTPAAALGLPALDVSAAAQHAG